jgi:hypothetical protein
LLSIEQIASITHAANRAYRACIGEEPGPAWSDLSPQEQHVIMAGVEKAPTHSPLALHDDWVTAKLEAGWVYGEEHNVEARTHPNLRPYDELPEAQRRKDNLFRGIAVALTRPLVYPYRVIGMDATDPDTGEYVDLRISPMLAIDVVSGLVDTLRHHLMPVPDAPADVAEVEEPEVQIVQPNVFDESVS